MNHQGNLNPFMKGEEISKKEVSHSFNDLFPPHLPVGPVLSSPDPTSPPIPSLLSLRLHLGLGLIHLHDDEGVRDLRLRSRNRALTIGGDLVLLDVGDLLHTVSIHSPTFIRCSKPITYLWHRCLVRPNHTLDERDSRPLAALAGADGDVLQHRGVADDAAEGVAGDVFTPLAAGGVGEAGADKLGLKGLELLLVAELVGHDGGGGVVERARSGGEELEKSDGERRVYG